MTRTCVYAAVEGDVDAAVVKRLIDAAGGKVAQVYVKRGKANLRNKMQAYSKAASRNPWFVLVDLDNDFNGCARRFIEEWVGGAGRPQAAASVSVSQCER